MTPGDETSGTHHLFSKLWRHVTDDSSLIIYGFRRFKTTHSINLRFLEAEIDKKDHTIFHVGLSLGYSPTKIDRLRLRYAKTYASLHHSQGTVDQALLSRLRKLIKQYGMYTSIMQ